MWEQGAGLVGGVAWDSSGSINTIRSEPSSPSLNGRHRTKTLTVSRVSSSFPPAPLGAVLGGVFVGFFGSAAVVAVIQASY